MDDTSIIVDPQKMFETLQSLENHTKEFINAIHNYAGSLQEVASNTHATGFGALVKKAETEINQVGNAVVAVNNAINAACKGVANDLIGKFVMFGVKVDYSSPPFQNVHIKINLGDRAAIYPPLMRTHFDDLYNVNLKDIVIKFSDIYDDVYNTRTFWIGTSADRFRHNFEKRVKPEYDHLYHVTDKIIKHGLAWVEQTIKYEASIPTP